MLAPYAGEQIDIVVGMESRGFIFSAPMAYQLDAGLVPVRKLGKLPAETITVEYALEYGSNTLEIHRDAIQPGQKVLIVDDLLATGGTVHGHDRARRAAQGRGRRPRRSSSSSSSSRAATGSTDGASRASSSTDAAAGSRPAIGRPRHRSDRRVDRRPTTERSSPPAPARRPATAPTATPAPRRRRSTSGAAASSAASPASSSRPRPRWRARRRPSSRSRPRRPARSSTRPASRPRRRRPRRSEAAHLGRRPRRAASGRRSARTAASSTSSTSARLPDALVEYPCKSAGEVAFAIREMVVRGAPAIGQVAAIGLAMSAEHQRDGHAVRAPGDAPRARPTR